MLETAFIILISGCGHGDLPCTPIERIEVAATSQEACELQLDRALTGLTADWPEYAAECRRADDMPGVLVAELTD